MARKKPSRTYRRPLSDSEKQYYLQMLAEEEDALLQAEKTMNQAAAVLRKLELMRDELNKAVFHYNNYLAMKEDNAHKDSREQVNTATT